MASTDGVIQEQGTARWQTLAVLPVFATSLLLSAFLLFAVQPIIARMVLPLLGGSSSVWSVVTVFFQALLLLGYLYAHLLSTMLDARLARIVHVTLLATAAAALPFALPEWAGEPPVQNQSIWLLALLGVTVGLPFFAAAGNGPLLQAWFSRSGHARARDPYFLYAASNVGSLAALLTYPVLVEPVFTLAEQRLAWSAAFVLLGVLLALCAIVVAKGDRRAIAPIVLPTAGRRPGWADRASWVGLSFIPSGLLVASTSYISTDIASIPLLWVLPLALYLLTFILAFSDRPLVAPWLMLKVQPWLIGAIAFLAPLGMTSLSLGCILILSGLFLSAMVAHSGLYATRPDSSQLTEFYLWIALGGVLGGSFTALLAPLVFSDVYEFPLLLILALLCRPDLRTLSLRAWLPTAAALGLAALAAAAILGGPPGDGLAFYVILAVLVGLMALVMTSARRPGLMIGSAIALATLVWTVRLPASSETTRSFFGVNRVFETTDGQFRVLSHGTTIHGAQRIRTKEGAPYAGPPVPATYYYRGGAIAAVVEAVREVRRGLANVAAIGLGTGSLACYRLDGEQWRFFEIDSEVARIAGDGSKFRFVSECAPDAPIILGDARLTLTKAQERFDLIILDAFSSDAVPVHLLTREAIASFRAKLSPGGVLLFHVSNRHMDLAPFVARTASELGLIAFANVRDEEPNLKEDFFARSKVVALAERPGDLGDLASDARWSRLEPDATIRPWTDDFSSVVTAVWRNLTR